MTQSGILDSKPQVNDIAVSKLRLMILLRSDTSGYTYMHMYCMPAYMCAPTYSYTHKTFSKLKRITTDQSSREAKVSRVFRSFISKLLSNSISIKPQIL